MKIKKGFLLSEIDDTGVVVATGKMSKQFNGMVTLNSTGIFLWKILEHGADKETLVSKLMDEYEIDGKTAETDVDDFINTLKGANIIEDQHFFS